MSAIAAARQQTVGRAAPAVPAGDAAPEVTAAVETALILFLVDRGAPCSCG